jgi:hypothetical protein
LTERLEFDLLFQSNMITHYPGMTFAEMHLWDEFAKANMRVPYPPRYHVWGKGQSKGGKPWGPDPEECPIDLIFAARAIHPAPPPVAPRHVPVPSPPRPTRAPPTVPQPKRKDRPADTETATQGSGLPAKAKLEVQTKTILPLTPKTLPKPSAAIPIVDPRGR